MDLNKEFIKYCKLNDLYNLKILLNNYNIDINTTITRNMNTGLMEACNYGYPSIVEFLLEQKNINFDYQNNLGQTALHLACEKRNIKIIKILLKKNINLNLQDMYGYTPFILACELNNDEIIELLMEKNNLDYDLQDLGGNTALIHCYRNKNYKIINLMFNKFNLDINLQNNRKKSLIFYACMNNDIEFIEFLLKKKDLNLNLQDLQGNIPLIYLFKNNLNQQNYLIEKFIGKINDINIKNNNDETILFHACNSKNFKIVDFLFKKTNLNVNSKYSLLIAYYNHSYKILLHFLLDMRTDLNILFKKNIDIDIILTSLDKYLISDKDKAFILFRLLNNKYINNDNKEKIKELYKDFKLSKNEKLIVLCGDNIPFKKTKYDIFLK